MVISVPQELVSLAQIFKKNKEKLYLVGGFVRNKILGINDKYNLDIDVCSSALPEKVMKMLEGTEFSCAYMNKEIGVLEIQNKIRVEHATFRTEKYEFEGVHIPNNVEFIKDLNKDAKRRDFKCNAIYYDILEEEIIDPFDGVKDINNKIISTTIEPEKVFALDGERILRMVRFASTFGFEIDPKTYKEAKKNVSKLKMISKSRIREEFSKIVLADTKYPFLPDVKYAHARGLMMLADLDAIKYILPAVDMILKNPMYEDRGKLLIDHIMNVFALSQPEVRLSALLHDVGKAKAMIEYGNFNGGTDFAPVIIEQNLGIDGLGYSKKIVERVKRVVLAQDFNKYGTEIAKNIKKFIIQNKQDIELILALKVAINLDRNGKREMPFGTYRIYKIYKHMQKNKTPFSLSELNIDGNDILNSFPKIKSEKIGNLLNYLLAKSQMKPRLNTKAKLIKLCEKQINKDLEEYMEK